VVFQILDDVGNGGSLLSDGDVNAVQFSALIGALIVGFLVDDGIDGHCGFSSLSVSNDQLSLASSDGHQGVDCLQSSLHGFVD